jgi:hypothetical protein
MPRQPVNSMKEVVRPGRSEVDSNDREGGSVRREPGATFIDTRPVRQRRRTIRFL